MLTVGNVLEEWEMKMEIKINIDESCSNCKEAMKWFKELQKRHKDCYMNMDMKTFKRIDGIILIPDYNSEGYLTHFHIQRADLESLKNMVVSIEVSEKESKKIREMKEDLK